MKALVLGGGAMKGAFQAGALKAITETGFQPDVIYGISVGALNAAFLSHEAGVQTNSNEPLDWPGISRKLMSFWLTNITSPQAVGALRSKVALGLYTLVSQFEGLLDPAPLHQLIHQNIDIDVLRASPVPCTVGAVNINSGEIVYAGSEHEDFFKYLMASSSMPITMPAIPIGPEQDMFLDGALREVTPVRQAIADGATEIVTIACQSRMIYHREAFNPRNLISLIEKVRDITVNQMVNNDIVWAENYAERATLRGEPFKLTVIRPSEPLYLDMLHFNSDDISRLIVDGYRDGLKVLENQTVQ